MLSTGSAAGAAIGVSSAGSTGGSGARAAAWARGFAVEQAGDRLGIKAGGQLLQAQRPDGGREAPGRQQQAGEQGRPRQVDKTEQIADQAEQTLAPQAAQAQRQRPGRGRRRRGDGGRHQQYADGADGGLDAQGLAAPIGFGVQDAGHAEGGHQDGGQPGPEAQ
jgi:hypothetical protein